MQHHCTWTLTVSDFLPSPRRFSVSALSCGSMRRKGSITLPAKCCALDIDATAPATPADAAPPRLRTGTSLLTPLTPFTPFRVLASLGHADAHTRPLTAHTGCRIAPDKRKGMTSDNRLRNMSKLGRLEPKAGSWQGTDLKTSARQSLSPHFRQQPAGKLSALRLAFEHRARVLPLGRWQRRKPKGPADIPRPPGDQRQSRHLTLCPAHRLPVDSPCGHGARA